LVKKIPTKLFKLLSADSASRAVVLLLRSQGAKGDELFDSLMKWVELFLTVAREGLKEPISLEYHLPHSGKERDEIMAEVN
jgi:hypothetical protein